MFDQVLPMKRASRKEHQVELGRAAMAALVVDSNNTALTQPGQVHLEWQDSLANSQVQVLEQNASTFENITRRTSQSLEREAQRLKSGNCKLRRSKQHLFSIHAEFENEANLASKQTQHLKRENHLLSSAKLGFGKEVKAQMQKFTGETLKLAAEANLQVQMLAKERENILVEIASLKSEKFQRA